MAGHRPYLLILQWGRLQTCGPPRALTQLSSSRTSWRTYTSKAPVSSGAGMVESLTGSLAALFQPVSQRTERGARAGWLVTSLQATCGFQLVKHRFLLLVRSSVLATGPRKPGRTGLYYRSLHRLPFDVLLTDGSMTCSTSSARHRTPAWTSAAHRPPQRLRESSLRPTSPPRRAPLRRPLRGVDAGQAPGHPDRHRGAVHR
jgi:hypothetical protein